MNFMRLLLVTCIIPALLETTYAFEVCEKIVDNPGELSSQIGDAIIYRVPVRYHSLARSVKLVTKGSGEEFFPFAANVQDTKFVVIPLIFAKTMCKIAVARSLSLYGIQPEVFDEESKVAARCFDARGSRKKCLVDFSNNLVKRYRKAYVKMTDREGSVAFDSYQYALNQIIMHEYAHHFLDHFKKIRMKKITRIDAEFEADLFATLNGVQAGEAPGVMYYFFEGLADIERHTKKLSTEDYESAFCRSRNVVNITNYFQAMPMILLDAAYGGDYKFGGSSPAEVRSYANSHFSKEPPGLLLESCGKIAKTMLDKSYRELNELYLRMEKDFDILFAGENDVEMERASRLLRDLSKMSTEFQYMNGIAAKSIALMLREWGMRGRKLVPIIGQIDRLLGNSSLTDNFLAEDFGILLYVQGLATLKDRTDIAIQSRLDQSFPILERSVRYNPDLVEAWTNLAFIAFKQGNCPLAAGFAIKGMVTSAVDEERNRLEKFSKLLIEYSFDPETCKAKAATFHPYPGL